MAAISNEVSAGFYAVAYELGGQKIISYRGTDSLFEPFWSDTGSDPWNGYSLGAGSPIGNQSSLALAFYEAVVGSRNLLSADVSLTGHSVGGGCIWRVYSPPCAGIWGGK